MKEFNFWWLLFSASFAGNTKIEIRRNQKNDESTKRFFRKGVSGIFMCVLAGAAPGSWMYDDSMGGGAILKRAAPGNWMYSDSFGGGAVLKRAMPSMGGMWNSVYKQKRKFDNISMTFLFNDIFKEGRTISGVNSGAKMHGNDHIPVRLDQAVMQISLACTNGSQPNSLPIALFQSIDCP